MNSVKRLLNIAVAQAYKSDMYHQHGAVLFNGHRVLGLGYNRVDRSKTQFREMMFSTHAEQDCIQRFSYVIKKGTKKYRNISNVKNYDILVVRISKSGSLVNSRPCDDCIKKLLSLGVNRIYYSNDKGEVIREKLSDMALGHVSAGKLHMIRCGHARSSIP